MYSFYFDKSRVKKKLKNSIITKIYFYFLFSFQSNEFNEDMILFHTQYFHLSIIHQ